MTAKIFKSILFATTCALFASLVFILGVLYSYFSRQQESQLDNMLLISSVGVENSGLDYLENLNEDSRLTWVSENGTVLYDSENNKSKMENHAEREEVKEALKDGHGDSIRYSDTLMEKTMYRAMRLTDGTVLRISASYASEWRLFLEMVQPLIVIFFVAIIISAVISYKLSEKITRPLEEIDLDNPLKNEPYKELHPLLQKLDYQHRKIESQRKELADRANNMDFAEQNRREFTANVSHELKTPLQAIMGSAELMENGLVKSEDIKNFAGKIHSESTRLLSLIDDIIHLSRLDENEPMNFENVNVYDICAETISSVSSVAETYDVSVDLVGERFTISGIPQLFKDIVNNLVTNAIKYNKPGGRVTVRLTETENFKVISVSDTGIGIPKEYTDRIFERFFRVDKSHSKETGGTGLGLSIVKHAVSYMKGEISVESVEGVGTTISVKFEK